MLVSMPQFMANAGICVGYFTCYGSVQIESSFSWRGQLCFSDLPKSPCLPSMQHHTSFKLSSDSSWLPHRSSYLNHPAGCCSTATATRLSRNSYASTLVPWRLRKTYSVPPLNNRYPPDNPVLLRDSLDSSESHTVSPHCLLFTCWESYNSAVLMVCST